MAKVRKMKGTGTSGSDNPRKMRGMALHGGVAPKGSTTGGGPNGSSGQANSQFQITGIVDRKAPSSRLLLQRAKQDKAQIKADSARRAADKKGPSLADVRRKKKFGKF